MRVSCFSYNPQNSSIITPMGSIGKVNDLLSTKYENIVLIGDLNASKSDASVENFCDIYSFKSKMH